MKIRTYIKSVILLAALSFVWGCGSGGGGATGTATTGTFVSKATLSGTPSPSVKGIEIILNLPVGVTVKTLDANGTVADGVIAFPNSSTNAGKIGLKTAKFTAATGTQTTGKLDIVIMVNNPQTDSFVADDNFFTVTCDVAAGVTVSSTSITFGGAPILYDANGAILLLPVKGAITVDGTAGTPIAGGISAQAALTSGLYTFKYDSYLAGVVYHANRSPNIRVVNYFPGYFAIEAIGLATDGSNSLTESWNYWDYTLGTVGGWTTTRPTYLPPGTFNGGSDYYLTPSGWVSGSSGPSGFTASFSADNTTTTITNKYDGSQAQISTTAMDISGLKLSTVAANTPFVPFLNTSTAQKVLPAGSVLYKMSFTQTTDSYNVWDNGSVISASALADVPTSSPSPYINIDNNSGNIEFFAQFDTTTGNTVKIFMQDYSTSPPIVTQIGTAPWAITTVSGQQLLLITIPQTLRDSYKLGGDPFFAVINGGVKQGVRKIGGQISYSDGGTSFNKVVADYVVTNFNLIAASVTVARPISLAILGF